MRIRALSVFEHVVYHYGVNPVTDVVAAGRLVVRDTRRVAD